VEVAGETPVGPTILLLPGVTQARLALTQKDTVGFGGEHPCRQSVESDARPW